MARKPSLEKFEVRNRWTGEVQFTAEIETTPAMTPRVKRDIALESSLLSRSLPSRGSEMLVRMPLMAMTISISASVNPAWSLL